MVHIGKAIVISFKDGEEETLERVLSVLSNKVQIEPDSKNPTYMKTVIGVGYKFDLQRSV